MKYPRGYYDVFVQACAKYPYRIAAQSYDGGQYKTYTYSELYGVCEYLSQILQQLGCNKGVIGLVSNRNIIIPCIIAAAHKCCTSFMFIDPSQDLDNISNIEIRYTVVIHITKETLIQDDESNAAEVLPRKPDKTVTLFDFVISFYYFGSVDQPAYQYLEEHSFIAQTSGSTGPPKNIQVPVRCLQPNIDDLTKLFDITPEDVVYFSTPLTFDPSMVEILLACMNGASLLVAPNQLDVLFPENKNNSITVWQTTPSLFFQNSNADIKKILGARTTLRILALGGEPLNGVRRLRELKHLDNKTKIFTLYGVTEMSCWACAAELLLNRDMTDKEVPLGRCLSETQVIVKPESHANKDTGKIVLVSKTRKCIILNNRSKNDEMNSMKFINTGDNAEVKRGIVYYRGRSDDVVKRFGHKINLQLIESIVMECPRIKTCSCVWLPKPMLLVVYFSSETFSSNNLSDFLKCKLDDKHWPDKILRVENLPTNTHGKITRLMISEMYDKKPILPPTLDSLKVKLLQELQAVLSGNFTFDDISNKNFFSIGGTSFLAITVCNSISISNPHFGKFLLTHLMSQRSFDHIMRVAEKELLSGQGPIKSAKRLKRTGSDSEKSLEFRPKRQIVSPHTPVEFVLLWSYDTGKCVDASPTLFRTDRNLYVAVGSHSGKIIVVDALLGELQGMINLKARVEASVFCYFEKPVLMPCGVVGAHDGTVVCFLLEDCEEKWRINIGAMVKSKATCCNGFLYIAAYDGYIRSIDIMTGQIDQCIKVSEQAISADLVLAKNQFILTGSLSGVCASIHTETNSVAWRATLASPVFASPALYDNDKYVVFAEVSGEIHCRTVEKGIKIWKYYGAKGNIFSSLYIRYIDKLKWQMVFGCHDNKVYSINVKNFQPSLNWTTQLTSPIYSTPCGLNDNLLLAVSNNGVMCVMDVNNGAIVKEYHLPNETFSSPSVYNDYVFIGCRNDHLYSFRCIVNV